MSIKYWIKVLSLKYDVCHIKYELWSIECKVWIIEHTLRIHYIVNVTLFWARSRDFNVWSLECRTGSVCNEENWVWNMEYGVWSMEYVVHSMDYWTKGNIYGVFIMLYAYGIECMT